MKREKCAEIITLKTRNIAGISQTVANTKLMLLGDRIFVQIIEQTRSDENKLGHFYR